MEKCCQCKMGGMQLYRPPYDDGTYPGECGRCLLKERDKLKHALERVVHEMGIAKTALDEKP